VLLTRYYECKGERTKEYGMEGAHSIPKKVRNKSFLNQKPTGKNSASIENNTEMELKSYRVRY
jgi:hypothetical protein